MTVTFNTQLNGVVPKFSLDDEAVITTEEKSETLYKKFFASQEAKAKVKQYPVSHWWVTRVYHTTSESLLLNGCLLIILVMVRYKIRQMVL
jgi:hypothetical protein